MRTFLKIFITGGLLFFTTACGLINGELLRPLGEIDAGSATPDGGDSTAPLVPPTTPPTTPPAPPSTPVDVNTWGTWGSATDISKIGNYVLSGGTRGLEIYDYSNPAAPILVNSVLNSEITHISTHLNFAFVSYANGKFEILDMANPAGPALLAEHTFTDPSRARAANGYVYVPDGYQGVHIIKLDAPTSIVRTMIIKDNTGIGNGFAKAVEIDNGYLYVTDTDYYQVSVHNLTDPENPIEEAEIYTSDEPADLKVKNQYIYTAIPWTGLDVFKFTPGAGTPLTQVAGYYDPNWTYQTDFFNLQISGNYLFALNSGNSSYDALISFDIGTDPESPTPVSWAHHGDTYFNGNNFYIADGTAYMAYGPNGIRTINVTDPTNINLPYSYQGPEWWLYAVAVKGDYAYACASNEGHLKVFNISVPAKPTLVTGLPDMACDKDLLVDGDYLYVSSGNVDIYDISAPASPVFKKTITIGSTRYLSKSGNRLIVTANGNFPHIINVTDPPNAVLYTNNAAQNTTQNHVVAEGDYAYFVGSGGLKIVNISNPATPTHVGSLAIKYMGTTNLTGYTISKSGDFVYAHGESGVNRGFYVFDVSNPASPQLVKSFDGLDRVASMTVAGTKLYYCQYDIGIIEFDISTPASTSMSNVYPTGACLDVHYANGILYSADESTGLRIIDFTKPESYDWVKDGHRGQGTALQLVGSYGFVQNGYLGVSIFDMTNPKKPVYLKSIKSPSYVDAFLVHNNKIYIGDDFHMSIYDISNINSPVFLSEIPKYGSNYAGFVVSGNYMYSAEGDLVVYDISTPGAPTYVRKIAGKAGSSVRVNNGKLYAADSSEGVHIYDISSTPDNPTFVATYTTPDASDYWNQAWDVTVDGDYMYVAYLRKGVEIVDLSGASPARVALYNTPSEARSIRKQGDYVYVADYQGGLHILNVTAPNAPTLKRTLSSVETKGNPGNVEVSGNYLHVMTYLENWEIFDISNMDDIHQ